MSDRWTDPAEESAQPAEQVDEERLTALDKLVLPRRAPMRALSELLVSASTVRNVRNRDRVIE